MAAGMETHSLDLSEEDQLQIALAISAEEQQLSATEAEDARLARQLQEAEYAQAQAAAAGAAAVATAAAAGAPNAAPAAAAPQHAAMPMPAGSAGQPAYASTPGMASSSSGGLVDSLRVNAADAMQRIGSGSQQLWTRLRRQVGDAQPPPPPPPYYQQPLPHLPPPYYAQPAHHQPPYPPPTQLQHGTASCAPWQQAQQAQQPPRGALNEDEALALALQRQFDLEDQYQQQQPQQQQHQPPPPPQPQPGAMQPGRVATGPLGAGAAAATAAAAAAAGAPSVPARHGAGAGADPPGAKAGPTARPVPPTSSTASQPAAAAAAAQPAQRLPVEAAAAAAAPSTGRNRCAGCGGSLFSLLGGSRGAYIQALGRHWHPGCLVCGGCRKPIGSTGGVSFTERDGLPYHIPCFKEKFHPKCSVCHEFIPEQGSRRIVWNEVPFWRQRYCPSHEGAAPRCAGCSRLRTYGEDWAELEDQRQLCLSCLDTITTDTRDAQPLWQNVLAFYAELGLPLPVVPPMMLVDSGALNDAEGQETHGRGRGGGPVFHVRGLILAEQYAYINAQHKVSNMHTLLVPLQALPLTEEYASIRTILRIPGGNPFAVQRESVQVGPTRCEVTGILVLYGLPRLLTGSILAHEVMHAYLRMAGCTRLEEQVEEGLAQLMALLWLEAQAGKGFKDEYEERLAAYLGHQIRSDTSPIYGDGFRMAHEAFQVHGLERVLHHVRQTGTFPPC